MIYGKKIYLREILKEDIDIAYNLCSDSEVLKYNGYQYGVSSKKYMVEHLKYLNIPSKRSYVIINKPGTIVGVITYSEDKYSRNVYNISLTIGKKYWRRGYGTDSIKANKVELEVVRENEAAVLCYKKCGFVEEGIRRKKYYYKGDYLDTIVMGLLKEEFKV